MRLRSSRRRRSRHHHRPWYRRITRGQIGFAIALALGALGLVFGIQAAQASSALRLSSVQAEVLQGQIVAGDDAGARITLTALQQASAKAHDKTQGALWRAGAHIPLLGKNVKAITTVADVVDEISTHALPPLVDLAAQANLKTFSPHDGKVDLDTIRKIRPSVIAAAASLASANDKLAGIDAESLLVPIRGPVGALQLKIESAQSAARSSAVAARLMPSMLGAKQTRRYLLLIQNNAEIRPTGGIAGSFALLKAKDGALSMGQQGSIKEFGPLEEPVLPMTAGESSVYSSVLMSDIRDTNLTPDFPRTGQISRAMAKKKLGVTVDGVITVDPVALSYLLAGTGPVVAADKFVIDQANVVDVLLNDIYLKYQDNELQDEIFADTARTIFDVIKSGRGDPRLIVGAMVRAADENRLALWSSHKKEQQEIGTTGLSGHVGGDEGDVPHIGVYLSDSASTKMEYYLDYSTTANAARCLDGGMQELSTTTDITSNAPDDAHKLSPFVTGSGAYTPRGTMSLIVRIYSPYGGGFSSVQLDGKKQTIYADRHLGRNVTRVALRLKPGERHTITTTMISGKGQRADGVLSTTPGVRNSGRDVVIRSACR